MSSSTRFGNDLDTFSLSFLQDYYLLYTGVKCFLVSSCVTLLLRMSPILVLLLIFAAVGLGLVLIAVCCVHIYRTTGNSTEPIPGSLPRLRVGEQPRNLHPSVHHPSPTHVSSSPATKLRSYDQQDTSDTKQDDNMPEEMVPEQCGTSDTESTTQMYYLSVAGDGTVQSVL